MKNGFTLIELLTVIVLLGVIAAITVPIIVDTINNSRYDSCEENIRTIENAAERWHAHNPSEVSKDTSYSIRVSRLQDEGYLSADDDIINPVTNDSMGDEEVTITFDNEYNQYSYKMREGICTK